MSLEALKNGWLYVVGGIVALFVIAQSIFFLLRALRRGKEIGVSTETMKKAISSSAIFSVVPSLAILITVLTLAKALGLALPWIRLSVIGAIAYELPAAQTAAAAYGQGIASTITDPEAFSSIAWVMTACSLPPLVLLAIAFKRTQKGISKIQQKDKKWGEVFSSAIFIGLIAAFIGYALSGSVATDAVSGVTTVFGSSISILTLLSSALIMVVCALFIKKGCKWLENFAMPFSMIGAMALSILYWNILPDAVRSWRIPGLF